jgi:hypothetical protein
MNREETLDFVEETLEVVQCLAQSDHPDTQKQGKILLACGEVVKILDFAQIETVTVQEIESISRQVVEDSLEVLIRCVVEVLEGRTEPLFRYLPWGHKALKLADAVEKPLDQMARILGVAGDQFILSQDLSRIWIEFVKDLLPELVEVADSDADKLLTYSPPQKPDVPF